MAAKTRTELLEQINDLLGEYRMHMGMLAAGDRAQHKLQEQCDNWRKSTEDMQAEKARYLEQIEVQRLELVQLETDLDNATRRSADAHDKRAKAEAVTKDVSAENERLREFDPISDKQRHADMQAPQLAGHPFPPPPTYRGTDCIGIAPRETWYQRRA